MPLPTTPGAAFPRYHARRRADRPRPWDGGDSANPPIAPLFADESENAIEILLIQVNPDHRPHVPASATGIRERVNEITFNASPLNELRAFELSRLRRESDGSHPDDLPRLHRIAQHDGLGDAELSSNGSLDANDHRRLRDHGREVADRWLAGKRSSTPP